MPKAEGAAVLGTLRTGARARTIATEGPIELVVSGRLAERVRELARIEVASRRWRAIAR